MVLSVEERAGRRTVNIAGRDQECATPMVTAQLGNDVDVMGWGYGRRMLRPRRCVGYMEREPGRLQLRYVTCGDEHIDYIEVAEDDDSVVVLGTVCTSVMGEDGDAVECPYHKYLERPLGERTVIDGFGGEPVPFKNVYAEMEAAGAPALGGGADQGGRTIDACPTATPCVGGIRRNEAARAEDRRRDQERSMSERLEEAVRLESARR